MTLRRVTEGQWTTVAEEQGGLISRRQLRGIDVPARTVDHWLAGGRLRPTGAAGVYRVAGAPDTARTPAWFAVLSTRSPLSFHSAAAWWEMPVEPDGWVHITRFDRRRLDWPHGVRVHRVALDPSSVVSRRGLPVTSRPETVLDCMGALSFGRALTLADRALQQGWLSEPDIDRRLRNFSGRWGNRQIRRIADQLTRGVDAESERRLHELLRAAHLTGWVAQHPVTTRAGRFVIDVAFPELRLAVEVDGYAYHSDDVAFQRDRSRQNALIAAGWQVLRFTWRDIVERPHQVIAQIRALLAA